jgi:hypothetical protein
MERLLSHSQLKDMHTKDLILDFEKDAPTALRATAICQEKSIPFSPLFLSTYTTSSCIPGALNDEKDDESD